MRSLPLLRAAAGAAFAASCCAHAADVLPTMRVQLGPAPLTVEVAATLDAQRTGLMFRRSLPADRGMLFAFSQPRPMCYWMKNTIMPLSIAFIAPAHGAQRVTAIADMQPNTLAVHCSPGPAQFAIEVPQGWFARHGVAVGALLATR